MHKKKWLPAAFLFALASILVVLMTSFHKEQYSLQESKSLLSNPDRGIYVQVNTSRPDRLQKYGQLEGSERLRLTLLAFEMTGYEDRPLDDEKLEELEIALKAAREEHFSVIFRAAYSFDGEEYQDPDNIELVAEHIGQICSILNRHTDILLCVQAGMLGPYGEWHSSLYVDSGEYSEDAHRVVTAWQEGLPDFVSIALRRPSYVRGAVEMGADPERLTVHNDALLSTDSDLGTYHDPQYSREEELDYIAACPPVYMGGETTNVSEYTQISHAVQEFEKMGINYLNRYYNKDVWDSWNRQEIDGVSGQQYILSRLGYRLIAEQVDASELLWWRRLCITLKNSGFGRLDERVRFYLVVDDGSQKEYLELENQSDELESYQFNPSFFVKNKEGCRLGLKITRHDVETASDADCIQLANDDITYEDGTNYFDFLTLFT